MIAFENSNGRFAINDSPVLALLPSFLLLESIGYEPQMS